MLLEGGVDIEDLFRHVGKVQDGDTYEQAVKKIREALEKRGSRLAAVYKLFSHTWIKSNFMSFFSLSRWVLIFNILGLNAMK